MGLSRIRRGAGMSLESEYFSCRWRRLADVYLHVADRYRVMISLDGPRYLHHASVLSPDHETDCIGIRLCGSLAATAGVAEIAVTA